MAVKSFLSREDAEAFVAGKNIATKKEGPEKFYAVAVGHPTGIFNDWTDASLAIKGVKGPKYKKFGTRAEAVQYIRENGNKEAVEKLGEAPPAEPEEKPAKRLKTDAAPSQADDGILRIYTDGSSLANGRASSRAGLGVFFGENDARNLAERLPGGLQTNQRAELMAMQRALEIADRKTPVQIISDSQYSINCVTQWATNWKRKGWKTATGEDVKNQDIIRKVLEVMEAREAATTFKWVKGHSTDRGNNAADVLANQGARMEEC